MSDNELQDSSPQETTPQQLPDDDVEISELTGKPKVPGGATGKGFVKGDPRINRKGRPKSFNEMRKLAQSIAVERSEPGSAQTTIEVLLRGLVKKDPEHFIEIAYGKVPEHLIQDGEVVFRVVRDGRVQDTSENTSQASE